MKTFFVVLLVLLVSGLAFAGEAQWWWCGAWLEGQPRSRIVCATSLNDAGMKAVATGLCGYKNPVYPKQEREPNAPFLSHDTNKNPL